MSEVLILCLKIVVFRIIEVSLETCSNYFAIKKRKIPSAILGFFNAFIWFTVINEAIAYDGDNKILVGLFYGLGLALGRYIGIIISNKLSKEYYSIQIITSDDNLADELANKGYGISKLDVKGYDDSKKKMLIVEVKDDHVKEIEELVKELDEDAFITIKPTEIAINGFYRY